MKNVFKCMCAMFVATIAIPAVADEPNLCEAGEYLYHGCQTTKGKIVSLCTDTVAQSMDEAPAYLVYRFGRLGKVELTYPPRKPYSGDHFKTTLARYVGANTRFLAYFKNGQTEYLYEDAYLEAERVHGIGVFNRGKRVAFVPCNDHFANENEPSDILDNELFSE